MEPVIHHLPLIQDETSGIRNADARRLQADRSGTRIEIWVAGVAVAISFTAGFLLGLFNR